MLQSFKSLALIILFAALSFSTLAQTVSSEEALKTLPESVGSFKAKRANADQETSGAERLEGVAPGDFGVVSAATRLYVSPQGERIKAALIKTSSEGGAYSLLASETDEADIDCEFGSACLIEEGRVAFSKGSSYVSIGYSTESVGARASRTTLLDFARRLTEKMDAGAGSIPALALHLPDWEGAKGRADYAVSLPALQTIVGNRPILDAISFDGGAEAATASYGSARLVIIEFTTPQYSVENDARITKRISELRDAGQPAPSSYRREGNYSVFVFDAPDEATAASLSGQVKYEKDVRWLGDNPRVGEAAEKFYRTTMTGVVVTVFKTTGLAILICLGIGGVVGGAVFVYRRTRPTSKEAYTDAGGMLRLEIEDLNAPRERSKLLSEVGKR